MLGNIILPPLLFLMVSILPLGFQYIQDIQEEALKGDQKEAYSYIESIKKEAQSNKEIIIVDWETVGNAPRETKVEFEKDMLAKNYKVQSSHDGIVVYRK